MNVKQDSVDFSVTSASMDTSILALTIIQSAFLASVMFTERLRRFVISDQARVSAKRASVDHDVINVSLASRPTSQTVFHAIARQLEARRISAIVMASVLVSVILLENDVNSA